MSFSKGSARGRATALLAGVSAIALAAIAGPAMATQTIDNATVTVPGSQASPWVVAGGFIIGAAGTGTLDVNNGGSISTNSCGPLNMGQNAGSSGTLLIHDAGSHLDNGACGINVGQAGAGTVTISNGGVLDTLNGSQVGGASTSVGVVTVTGTGSAWHFTSLAVGLNGQGTVNVLSGGSITQSACGNVSLGTGFSGVGAITVDGAGSHWASGGCGFDLGVNGTGSLSVTNGGVVDGVNGALVLGDTFNTTHGTVTISGTGSKFVSTNNVVVGDFGVGALSISGGGTLSDVQSVLGDQNGSSGTATVDGAGSTWTSSFNLGVGRNGDGALTISNGGVVTSVGGFVSGQTTGAITITGTGSRWTDNGALDLGDRGTTTVQINTGGVLSDTNGSSGVNSNAIANITIDGAGSAWNNSGTLDLGNGFNSAVNLKVQNGAQLTDTSATLQSGQVSVTGASSAWTSSGLLRVGGSGAGVLTIAQNGTVNAPGVILGQSSSSSGVINIGGAVGQPAASPGTLQTPAVVLGVGNGAQGTLNFNHNSIAYQFTPLISGPGKVNVTAGLTIFTADNTYTGVTTIASGASLQLGAGGATGSITGNLVDNGTLYFIRSNALSYGGAISGSGALTVFGSNSIVTLSGASTYTGLTDVLAGTLLVNGSLGNTPVTVSTTAALGGSGAIGGPVSVANSGILLGVGGQTLTTGALTMSPVAIFNATLGAPSATRLINVNGDLTLDGTLNITDAGGFGPGLYRLIDYTGNLTDNTLNLGALPSGVQSSSLTIQTSTAHQVNLVFGAAAVATPFWNGTTTTPTGSVVGGAGTWKLGPTNWTDANGANSGPWDGTVGVFAGTGGAVTIDNSAGAVSATGVQFAVGGYSLGGGALTLTGPTPVLRVGDGTVGGAGITATVNGVIAGVNGFNKTDFGTLVLTGANTYTGLTTISGGYVSVSSDANLGGGAALITLNGGGLIVTSSFSTQRNTAVSAASELRTAAGATYTLGGPLSGSGDLLKSGAGTFIIAGSGGPGYSGALTVGAGRLSVLSPLGATTVTVQSGASLSGSSTISGAVTIASGGTLVGAQGQTLTTGSLTFNPTSILDASLGAPSATRLVNVNGALTLDGQLNVTALGGFGQGLYRLIDYTGALTDNGMSIGTLPGGFQTGQFSIQTATAQQVNLVVAAPATTPFWNGATTTAAGSVVGGTGTWKVGPTNWTDANGANVGPWDGTFAIFAGTAGTVTVDNSAGAVSANGMQFAVGGYSVGGGPLTLSGATPIIRVGDGSAAGANDVATINDVLAGSNGLTKTDLGTLVLTGANTYTGGTAINGGAVSVAADSGLGGAGGVTFNGGALIATGTFVSNRAFAFAGAGEIQTTPAASLNLGGVLSGGGTFAKTGTGTLILAGASTYNGAATIAAGLVRLNGSMAGNVQVQSGGTLGGAGSTTGAVSVANGGTLLGIQGQTLTTGSLTLANTSIIQTTLGAPGSLALFHVNGNLTLDGQLNVSSPGGFGVGLYRLIDYTGALTNNGLTLGVTPASVPQSQLAIQTAVANQVNLVVSAPAAPPILFWNGPNTSPTGTVAGGAGTWKLGPTNWTDANGQVSVGWNSDFGVFAGAAGAVTVDGSAGGISANGLQFATSGYTVGGAALTLTGAAPTLRVGDGTAAGAGYVAAINAAIGGSNGLIKTDLGTLVLGGTNTYAGGTTVNGGFVQAGADANLGAAGGAVTLNGGGLIAGAAFTSNRTLALAGTGEVRTGAGVNLTLTGAVSGAGALTKSGAGTLTLSGVSSYSGVATVAAGTLRVDGALPGSVSVQNGARLQGTGNVGATSVASGGTVAAGDSIGTLTVTGNATFAAGSTLEVELNAQGQADLVHATGTASVLGGTVNVLSAPGAYALGQRFTIVSADGGESGAFTTLNADIGMLFLKLGLSYDPNHVFLDVVRNGTAFCSVAQTANQCAAANGADSLGTGKAVFNAIANLNDPASARAAFDAISGEIGPAAKGAELEDSRFVRDAAITRARLASAGDAAGQTVNGAWGQVFGSWGHADSDGNAGAVHRDIGGFVLGADRAFGRTWRAGALGGYSHANLELPSRASGGDDSAYHLGLYGGAQAGGWGVRFGGAIAWHDVTTARAATFPGFVDALAGHYHARTGQLFGEIGYAWNQGTTTLEPYAGLAHVMLHTDGFTEKDGPAALTSAASVQSVTFARLGLRGQTSADLGPAKVELHAGAAWRHAFGDVTPVSRFSFVAGGNAFAIDGLPLSRDAATLDAGASVAISARARLDVSYTGQVGRAVQDHGAKATVSVAF